MSQSTDEEAARLISAETVGAAMQEAWDDFTSDTDCYPPDFEITRGPRLWANFVGGQIASGAACQLRPAVSAALSALTTKSEEQAVEITRLREALEAIADGEGDADVIARQTLAEGGKP